MPSGQRLRVGLVFDDTLDSSDGVAQYVKTLGAWLSGHDHEVSYLVGETKSDDWRGGKVYSLSRNLHVKFNGNKLSMPLVPRIRLIKQVVGEGDFDVLHVMLPCSPLMASRVIAAAGKSSAAVGTFHIFPSGRLSSVGSRVLRLLLTPTLRRLDSVVSVSLPAKSFASDAYHLRSDVLPNPVQLESFMSSGVKNIRKRIVFLGRLVQRKGCEQLIVAFANLSRRIPEAELVIAGSGPQWEKLKKLTKASGLEGRISFLGYVDEKDKPGLLASADIACFPSLYGESFGIVLLEAMAAGAGVVLGGDNPGYRSVLGDQPDLLIDPTDTDAFTGKLEQLLEDRRLHRRLHNWQSEAVKQYDIEVVGPKVVDLYRSSIAKARKKSHNTHHGKP